MKGHPDFGGAAICVNQSHKQRDVSCLDLSRRFSNWDGARSRADLDGLLLRQQGSVLTWSSN
jgi:hypothetical protein